jgi:hypothetical protein
MTVYSPQINGSERDAGSNGWFISPVDATASASDPLPGSGLAAFSYDLNGSGWLSYSQPLSLSDGVHSLRLQASDNAGNSAQSVQTVQVDTITPALEISILGSAGANGWYRSTVRVSAAASDSGSGLVTFETKLDGTGWNPYTAPVDLGDGVHNINVRALDLAGNSTQWGQSFQVDTISPVLDMTVAGTLGSSGWYISPVQISLSAHDPATSPSPSSGLSALEYNLDGAGWTTYNTPLMVGDGLHNLELRATDLAGNIASGVQSFRVDTAPPTIDVNVSGAQGTNPWYISIVKVEAVADDTTSDLSSLEVKVDGNDWSIYNAPLVFGDGAHSYRFRARDNAGNFILTSPQTLLVDTLLPAIGLPKSWDLGESVGFELFDHGSGLASVRLVIQDGNERYPKVSWQDALESYEFDGEIKWNGRFKDGTLAPPGREYYATLKVTDNAGNESQVSGQIDVTLSSYMNTWIDSSGDLVTGTAGTDPIVTQVPDIGNDETNMLQSTGENPLSTLRFGGEDNDAGSTGESNALNLGGGNNGAAQPTDAQSGKASFSAGGQSPFALPSAPSNLLWGASAAAAIGAFAAEITRKKQEAEAKLRAAEAKLNESIARQERRDGNNYVQKIQNNKKAQLEAEWALERQIAQAEAEQRKQIATDPRVSQKEETIEAEMRAYTNKPQELGASYYQYMAQKTYERFRAQEMETPETVPPTKEEVPWWENTKDLFNEYIVQPVNDYLYHPYIKPALTNIAEKVTDTYSWVDKNVYQPHIKPALEDAKQKITAGLEVAYEKIYQPYVMPVVDKIAVEVSKGMAWMNEKFIEPYVQPFMENAITIISEGVAWANEKIYQPYIQPAFAYINENLYQPHVKPFLEKAKYEIASDLSWLNQTIYQPFLQPIVADINQYIYQPLIKPLQDEATAWWKETWEKYGEWVHGALDTVGFIPAFGDACDAINGLIYLAEGRYLEASLSAMAIIPLVGDLGKLGKWGAKLGMEVVEEVGEKVLKEIGEEIAEEVLEVAAEKTIKQVGEVLVEKSAVELGEEIVEKGAKEFGEELSGKILKEAGEGITEKATKESVKELAEKTIRESNEKVLKQTSKVTVEQGVETTVKTVSKNTSKEVSQQVSQKVTSQTIQEIDLVAKYSVNATKVVEAVGPEAAEKLLKTLDKDVVEYIVEQGPEAIYALSKWSDADLLEYGPELALRAKNDAIALKATSKLVELLKNMDPDQAELLIDIMKTRGTNGLVHTVETESRQLLMDSDNFKTAKELIETIASNSTHYADGKQIVLGKWVDQGDGFTLVARNTGSMHYNPHPDLWNLFSGLGDKNREAAAWLINKQVVETGIVKGLPIEFALEGVPVDQLLTEKRVVELIFSGASDAKIMSNIKVNKLTVRWQELMELQKAGYEYAFDEVNNSFIFSLPKGVR